MKIDEFCARYSGGRRNIDDVLRAWQLAEFDDLLRTLRDQHDQLVGAAVIAGDAIDGDGMLDQIPQQLRDAFASLMHAKADTYDEMRQILRSTIELPGGGYLRFDDDHVRGFISKLKGQIGENIFQRHVGSAAQLADSGNQEAWDVVVKHADRAYEYVQVKLYADAPKVVQHMVKVQEKALNRLIEGCDHEKVEQIDFAVPADIADKVRELKEKYSQLQSIRIRPIPIGPQAAADIVEEGLGNVGPDQLAHFFHELLGGAVAAGSLHGIVNGFLWYKGAKEISAAIADAAGSSAVSTAGIGMGLVAETLWHSAMFSGAVGIGGRLFLGRLARSRWSFAKFILNSIAETKTLVAVIQRSASVS